MCACGGQIHFHEVGAVDSIIDTVGVVLALHLLGVQEVWASSLPFGEVRTPRPNAFYLLDDLLTVFQEISIFYLRWVLGLCGSLTMAFSRLLMAPPAVLSS